MQDTVLLIDGSADRRLQIRRALERRGCVVAGEAGSVPEIIETIASLDGMPTTVLVGSRILGSSANKVARLVKRTWPGALVIQERSPLREAVAV